MSRVLVTGGPGFIGRRVVQRFLARGWDVTSFSLPGEAPIASWTASVRMAHGDLGNLQAVADAASGCDLAIHLAAPVGVAGRYQWQWDIIAEGTRNVCEAIAAQGGRAVVAVAEVPPGPTPGWRRSSAASRPCSHRAQMPQASGTTTPAQPMAAIPRRRNARRSARKRRPISACTAAPSICTWQSNWPWPRGTTARWRWY